MTASTMPPPPSPPKRSGVIVPNEPRWFQRVGAFFVYAFIRCVSFTIRFRLLDDGSGLFGRSAGPGQAVYCVWHNRLALCIPMYERYAKKFGQTAGLATMASASKDGAFLCAILELLRVHPVRGSSSRRGPQALRELISWAERGYDLAITPDGPRGPRYVIQEGVMALAQITGLPIIPASYHLSCKITVNSWDKFQIPLPFSRCDIRAAEVIRVPRECSESERAKLRQNLEDALRAISED